MRMLDSPRTISVGPPFYEKLSEVKLYSVACHCFFMDKRNRDFLPFGLSTVWIVFSIFL